MILYSEYISKQLIRLKYNYWIDFGGILQYFGPKMFDYLPQNQSTISFEMLLAILLRHFTVADFFNNLRITTLIIWRKAKKIKI